MGRVIGLTPCVGPPINFHQKSNIHKFPQHLFHTRLAPATPIATLARQWRFGGMGGECPLQNPSRNHFKMGKVSSRSSTKFFKAPQSWKPLRLGQRGGVQTNVGLIRLRQIGGQVHAHLMHIYAIHITKV